MAESSTVVQFKPNMAGDADQLFRHLLERDDIAEAFVIVKLKDGRRLDHSTMGDADTLWELKQFERRLIEP